MAARRITEQRKAGILFPPKKAEKVVKLLDPGIRIQKKSTVYMAAVAQYLVAKALHVAGGYVEEGDRKIEPSHIKGVFLRHKGFHAVFNNVIVQGAGSAVIPYIPPCLLDTRKAPKRKSCKKPGSTASTVVAQEASSAPEATAEVNAPVPGPSSACTSSALGRSSKKPSAATAARVPKKLAFSNTKSAGRTPGPFGGGRKLRSTTYSISTLAPQEDEEDMEASQNVARTPSTRFTLLKATTDETLDFEEFHQTMYMTLEDEEEADVGEAEETADDDAEDSRSEVRQSACGTFGASESYLGETAGESSSSSEDEEPLRVRSCIEVEDLESEEEEEGGTKWRHTM